MNVRWWFSVKAWRSRYIVNDSFRTDVCLYYKPHMIAMAALLLACTYHECTLHKLCSSSALRDALNPTLRAAL